MSGAGGAAGSEFFDLTADDDDDKNVAMRPARTQNNETLRRAVLITAETEVEPYNANVTRIADLAIVSLPEPPSLPDSP